MVKVRDEQPLHYDGSINLELWLTQLCERTDLPSVALLRSACNFAWHAERNPEVRNDIWTKGSFETGLEMVDILSQLGLDEESFCAAVVYRAVREGKATIEQVRNTLGDHIAVLVEGVLKMAVISGIKIVTEEPVLGQSEAQVEQARKLLISLVDDVRVALIKLAERTCAIRSATDREPSKKQALAREVFDIYAPLSHRLGIGYLKWELEDLAFRYLDAESYKQVATLLDEKLTVRQNFVEETIIQIRESLLSMGIEADVHGRAKHIFSIWRKMQSKNIPFDQVYDMSAVRILVDSEDICYRVLGAVHRLWHNIPNEFDDYIATPKENGYRSLHTAVFGPGGKILEIQIRTREMHHEAEMGVCSHWQYKGIQHPAEEDKYERKLSWLRQLLDWQDEPGDFPGAARDLIAEVGKDRIYVFTPDGHVVDMMPEATPLDFAYRVHTEIGHHCVGARINGKAVSLRSPLVTGDQIEILTDDTARPRREWLDRHFGYLHSSRARINVQSWFYRRDRNKNIVEGKLILSGKLSKFGITLDCLTDADASTGCMDLDNLCTKLGAGLVSPATALEEIQKIDLLNADQQQALKLEVAKGKQAERESTVSGAGDANISIADCCQPHFPQGIVGVITHEDAVTVHRQDCRKVLTRKSIEKLIELRWRERIPDVFSVRLLMRAYDRPGLLFDLSAQMMEAKVNMTSLNTEFDQSQNLVSFRMDVDVKGVEELIELLEKIEQLHNVIEARKV